MIRSFRCKHTECLFNDESTGKFGAIEKSARRKLEILNAALELNDLRSPPGNRLEALVGDREGQHSIRINDQWRICFTWSDSDAEDVEIVDYHP
jgi:toxin HigB-1